jgi:hypothetical protein
VHFRRRQDGHLTTNKLTITIDKATILTYGPFSAELNGLPGTPLVLKTRMQLILPFQCSVLSVTLAVGAQRVTRITAIEELASVTVLKW